jgi:SSS family solute:Na+ symporter
VGFGLYSGTLAAIILGGASTVGGVKLGYQYGISGLWLVFMFGIGIFVLSTVLVPRILNMNLYTVPELLARLQPRHAHEPVRSLPHRRQRRRAIFQPL